MTFPTYTPRKSVRPRDYEELARFLRGIETHRLVLLTGQTGDLLVIGTNGVVTPTGIVSGSLTLSGSTILIDGDDFTCTSTNITLEPDTLLLMRATDGSGNPVLKLSTLAGTNRYLGFNINNISDSTWRVLAPLDFNGNMPIVGNDPPAVASGALGKVDLTAQTANIATTNLSNTPPAGFYEVEVYLMCTTADAGAGTLTVTIGWTDNVGATTSTPITLFPLTATGRTTGRQMVRVASGNITYAVTVTGAYGTSQYAVYVRVVGLG